MSDIEAIHRHLDANPLDHDARLVLADRLEDAGDEKADGYRAMGMWGRAPKENFRGLWYWTWTTTPSWYRSVYQAFGWCLPRDWWEGMRGETDSRHSGMDQPNRRTADDNAALAFTRLAADRRRELLAKLYGPAVEASTP